MEMRVFEPFFEKKKSPHPEIYFRCNLICDKHEHKLTPINRHTFRIYTQTNRKQIYLI